MSLNEPAAGACGLKAVLRTTMAASA